MTKYKTIIKKIAENNVEKQNILFDADGKEVIIETESYGQDRINQRLEVINAKIADAENFDKTATIKELAKEKLEVQEIQTEMDKVLEEPIEELTK